MIYGLIHPGSGLGNQLFRYITTRIVALDKGYDFTLVGSGYFKGREFMNLDFGKDLNPHPYVSIEDGGKIKVRENIPLWEENTPYYNPEINYLEDNTIIDGNFEDSRYWEHRMDEINKWLKVEILNVPDDVCAIGFRGGEFYTVPELGLPHTYFMEAIEDMLKINPDMKFEVHTDDLELAREFFPDFKCTKDIGVNWRSMRYAKHAIIANSSFYILPRLLKHFSSSAITISPKYWNRYNTKKWDYPQNYYHQFTHI